MAGNIVSADATASAILIHTEENRGDQPFNKRLSSEIDALIASESSPGVTIFQFGGPLMDATVGEFILQDVMTFVPLSLAVLFALLFVAFRTPRAW